MKSGGGRGSSGEEERAEVTWFGAERGRTSHRKAMEWLVEGEAVLDSGEVIRIEMRRNHSSGASAV